jgi:hypothetical protein
MWINENGQTSDTRPNDVYRDGVHLAETDITDDMLAEDGWIYQSDSLTTSTSTTVTL